MKRLSTRVKFNIITIIIFSLCGVLLSIGSNNIERIQENTNDLKEDIEQHWREQSRYSINNIIKQLDIDYKDGLVDIYDNNSLQKWADIRFDDVKNGSLYSDGWIAELETSEYIFTQSTMTRNEIIVRCYTDKSQYNMDSNILDSILNRISTGIPSSYGDNIEFITKDGSVWVEFSYYPIYHITNQEESSDKRIIVAIETKSEEIFKRYESYFTKQQQLIIHTYVVLYTLVFLGIILLTTIFIRHKG